MNLLCASFLVLLAVSFASAGGGVVSFYFDVQIDVEEGSANQIKKVDLYINHSVSSRRLKRHVTLGGWKKTDNSGDGQDERLGTGTNFYIFLENITGITLAWSPLESNTDPKPLKVSRMILLGKAKRGYLPRYAGKSIEFCYDGPAVMPGEMVDMVKCQ